MSAMEIQQQLHRLEKLQDTIGSSSRDQQVVTSSGRITTARRPGGGGGGSRSPTGQASFTQKSSRSGSNRSPRSASNSRRSSFADRSGASPTATPSAMPNRDIPLDATLWPKKGSLGTDVVGDDTLPLRRALFEDGQAEADSPCGRFGATDGVPAFDQTRSTWAEESPSALEEASEIALSPAAEYLQEAPTPIAAAGDAALSLAAKFESLSIPGLESTTLSDIASIMQFGCIGAEAVATLERVADAESWHMLNKQLNSIGKSTPGMSDATTLEEWDRRVTSHFGGLLEAPDVNQFSAATDADVWAGLKRQIEVLEAEVKGIEARHRDDAHDIELQNIKDFTERQENQKLDNELAQMQVGVHQFAGDFCDAKERRLVLREQISRLQRHVGAAVGIANNMTPHGVPFAPKELGPHETAEKVKEMMNQVNYRACQTDLGPKIERANNMKVDPLTWAQMRGIETPAAAPTTPGAAKPTTPRVITLGSQNLRASCGKRVFAVATPRARASFSGAVTETFSVGAGSTPKGAASSPTPARPSIAMVHAKSTPAGGHGGASPLRTVVVRPTASGNGSQWGVASSIAPSSRRPSVAPSVASSVGPMVDEPQVYGSAVVRRTISGFAGVPSNAGSVMSASISGMPMVVTRSQTAPIPAPQESEEEGQASSARFNL